MTVNLTLNELPAVRIYSLYSNLSLNLMEMVKVASQVNVTLNSFRPLISPEKVAAFALTGAKREKRLQTANQSADIFSNQYIGKMPKIA